MQFFFLKNTKISIFGGISKFHLLANFCSFGQFWAKFAALAVADSSPKIT
jgi:succinate-acetate transporter protein